MSDETAGRHFIQQIIDADIASGKWGPPGDRSVVRTRFPPEPNGFLHIGHAKAICLNAGLAEEFGGAFLLRFDDTNPVKEEQRYVDSIVEDVAWLGGQWEGMDGGTLFQPVRSERRAGSPSHPTTGVRFASDYFQQMHDWAVELIEKGLAYVDEQTAEQIRASRGSLTEPGAPSPWRDRPVGESLAEFDKMRRGEFADGARVLRAKIDMDSPNINLRDPVMYRVLNAAHHRTGDAWHIYPMYDWAHGLEDSIEGITHSICTLEFENHRPLYDWFIDAINQGRGPGSRWGEPIHHPQQIEFARFVLEHTVMSKRYLKELVDGAHIDGWDDPRLWTVAGLRRRGCTPESIRACVLDGGVTKFNASVPMSRLENAIRDDLNARAPRRMAVLKPLKLVITNWADHGDADRLEEMAAVNNPEDPAAGTRTVRFGRELWIERDDFMVDPPKGFFRLGPGREVRLRSGYWVTCQEYTTDTAGEVTEIRCTYVSATRGGDNPPPDAEGKVRKVKGTLHWVSAADAVDAEVRLFDRLYLAEKPGKATGNHLDDLNPASLEVVLGAKLERSLAEPAPDEPAWPDGIRRFQFERLGYFCEDAEAGRAEGRLVFNRTVTLKDSWAKEAQRG